MDVYWAVGLVLGSLLWVFSSGFGVGWRFGEGMLGLGGSWIGVTGVKFGGSLGWGEVVLGLWAGDSCQDGLHRPF